MKKQQFTVKSPYYNSYCSTRTIFKNWFSRQLFEIVQNLVDMGNLFHNFLHFCNEELDLNEECCVNILFRDRDTKAKKIYDKLKAKASI